MPRLYVELLFAFSDVCFLAAVIDPEARSRVVEYSANAVKPKGSYILRQACGVGVAFDVPVQAAASATAKLLGDARGESEYPLP